MKKTFTLIALFCVAIALTMIGWLGINMVLSDVAQEARFDEYYIGPPFEDNVLIIICSMITIGGIALFGCTVYLTVKP